MITYKLPTSLRNSAGMPIYKVLPVIKPIGGAPIFHILPVIGKGVRIM